MEQHSHYACKPGERIAIWEKILKIGHANEKSEESGEKRNTERLVWAFF
jgi:hypothetical protein